MESVYKFIMTAGSFSVLIPVGVILIRRQQLAKEQVYLAGLVLLSLLTEALALIIGKVMGRNNLFLIHFFTHGEFWLILLMFRGGMQSVFIQKGFLPLGIGFSVFALIDSLFFEQWNQFNWVARIVESGLVVVLCAHYYFITSRELKFRHLERVPMFWIVNALFVYFSANFMIYLFSNYLLPHKQESLVVWAAHAFFSCVEYILFGIALWMKRPLTYR